MARGKKESQEVEVISDVAARDVGAENPIADNPIEKNERIDGKWIKVTQKELVDLEMTGKLMGYDPATGEALLK